MFEFRKPGKGQKFCNGCTKHNPQDARDIAIRQSEQVNATVLSLCDNCRRELGRKIIEQDRNDKYCGNCDYLSSDLCTIYGLYTRHEEDHQELRIRLSSCFEALTKLEPCEDKDV
jgi:hypothetical protein